MRLSCLILLLSLTATLHGDPPETIRIASFNVWDVATRDLEEPDQGRVGRIVAVLQALRPDIVLINELAFDGAPGNAGRLAELLGASQGPGLSALDYAVFAAPSNTGLPSGLDLDNSGEVAMTPVPPGPNGDDGRPARQTTRGRAYGGDSWGFGTYPGQYAMALLVRSDLDIDRTGVRTFQNLTWNSMPGALIPDGRGDSAAWYDDEEAAALRLSSKSHWDVPVRLPDGRVLHVLASHPTPPAFDGDEQRNVRRNHDEIRFWRDYLDGAPYIVDDEGTQAGLADGLFVIVGDLNADPDEGRAQEAIQALLNHPRVQGSIVPRSEAALGGLDADDTATFGLRADYVLPGVGLEVVRAGVWRTPPPRGAFPSDHFPVWIDISLGTP